MKNSVFWDVGPCKFCVHRRLGGTYRPLFQSRKFRERGTSVSWVFSTGGSVCSHMLTLVLRSQIFIPWIWKRHIPPKRRFTQDLHGATSQKTALFLLKLIFYFYNYVLLLFYLMLTLSFRPNAFTRSYSTTRAEVCLQRFKFCALAMGKTANNPVNMIYAVMVARTLPNR
jgi:hypothetical protein